MIFCQVYREKCEEVHHESGARHQDQVSVRFGQTLCQIFTNAVTCSCYEYRLSGQLFLEFGLIEPEAGEKEKFHL